MMPSLRLGQPLPWVGQAQCQEGPLWYRGQLHRYRTQMVWYRGQLLWLQAQMMWYRGQLLWYRGHLLCYHGVPFAAAETVRWTAPLTWG